MKILPILLATTAVASVPMFASTNGGRGAADPVAARPAAEPAIAFAPRLAQAMPITGAAAWRVLSEAQIWAMIDHGADRQAGRWAYARSLIGQGLGSEAMSVLEAMRQDAPDLAVVDSFRLARGAALTLQGHGAQALDDLSPDTAESAGSPERCLWLMRALADTGRAAQSLRFMACAGPALSERPIAARAPFLIAAARAAVDGGEPRQALQWLSALPDRDAAANLYRGRAYAALGDAQAARLRLERVQVDGAVPLRMDAQLADIESRLASRALTPAKALEALAQFRYKWRGDSVERRALQLTYDLSAKTGNNAAALDAGATLLRYFKPGPSDAAFATEVRGRYRAMAEANDMPIEKAAGLFWTYRDLLPSGLEGDQLVGALADRLQRSGLYERAAMLLQYQLQNRTGDMARGPYGARVAALYILSGRPGRAITTLRSTDNPDYTEEMLAERRRVEAVALYQLGRVDQALALLDELPGSTTLRAEMLWRQKRWQAHVDAMAGMLPRITAGSRSLSAVDQTLVLRQAVSLAMLGRGEELAMLHARYAPAFAGASSAAAFDMIAGQGVADPARLVRAMAALPTATPAGAMADLFDVAPME